MGYRRKTESGSGYWYVRFKTTERAKPVIRSFKSLGYPPLADDEAEGHNPDYALGFPDAYAIAKGYDHQLVGQQPSVVVTDPTTEDLGSMLRQIIKFNEHAITEANKLRDLVAFNEWLFTPLELKLRGKVPKEED